MSNKRPDLTEFAIPRAVKGLAAPAVAGMPAPLPAVPEPSPPRPAESGAALEPALPSAPAMPKRAAAAKAGEGGSVAALLRSEPPAEEPRTTVSVRLRLSMQDRLDQLAFLLRRHKKTKQDLVEEALEDFLKRHGL